MTTDVFISFVRATPADAALFDALEHKVEDPRIYSPTFGTEAAVKEINKNNLYFIRRGGEVLGMAAYRMTPEGAAYICNVNIDPAHRRQGLARAAMEFLMGQIKAQRIELVTHPKNEGALNLYKSLGFKLEMHKENYFGDGEPRVVLAKTRV